MEKIYAFAISDGEGTLIDMGEGTAAFINEIMDAYDFTAATIIVGPADGTGE